MSVSDETVNVDDDDDDDDDADDVGDETDVASAEGGLKSSSLVLLLFS